MSSILKALKKLEGRRPETAPPVWPYGTADRDPVDRIVSRSRQWQKVLGILIIVCIAALAGARYFGAKRTPETADRDAVPSVSMVRQKAAVARKVHGIFSSPVTVPSPSVQTARDDAGPSAPESVRSDFAGETAANAPLSTSVTDAGLSLQALVWAEQPADRFAVINDRITHEGDTVNGSVITRIEPDDVVVRTDGRLWQLKPGEAK